MHVGCRLRTLDGYNALRSLNLVMILRRQEYTYNSRLQVSLINCITHALLLYSISCIRRGNINVRAPRTKSLAVLVVLGSMLVVRPAEHAILFWGFPRF